MTTEIKRGIGDDGRTIITAIVIDGVSKTIREWSKETGVPAHRISHRIHRGWDAERAIWQAVMGRPKRPKCNNQELQIRRTMIRRCYDPNNAGYSDYGGRGITVCERWLNSKESFLSDMGPRPPGTSIDRINNDGNYEPSNCRWATPREQVLNRRNNTRIKHDGKSLTASEWSEISGINKETIRARISAGWLPSDAVTLPTGAKRSNKSYKKNRKSRILPIGRKYRPRK